jgi:hypothetical protein
MTAPSDNLAVRPKPKHSRVKAVADFILNNLLVCVFGAAMGYIIIERLIAGKYGEAILIAAAFAVLTMMVMITSIMDKRRRRRANALLAETNQALQSAGYTLSPQPFVAETVYAVDDGLVRVVSTSYGVDVEPSTVEAQILVKKALSQVLLRQQDKDHLLGSSLTIITPRRWS